MGLNPLPSSSPPTRAYPCRGSAHDKNGRTVRRVGSVQGPDLKADWLAVPSDWGPTHPHHLIRNAPKFHDKAESHRNPKVNFKQHHRIHYVS